MSERQLGRLLEELREQLAESRSLDEQTRQQLEELRLQIAALVAGRQAEPREEGESIGDALQDYIDGIEDSHPRLTLTLGRIVDALNKIGI